jgi:hypothetical protein
MNCNLEKVLQIVKDHDLPFYLERNDFMNGGISAVEEAYDLTQEDKITENERDYILLHHQVWSARFYPDKDNVIIVYHAFFERVIDKILVELERYISCKNYV